MGRVEVCVNNAWGTVCNDNLFGSQEAMVLCHQLEGYQREGNHLSSILLSPSSLILSQEPPPILQQGKVLCSWSC